jgi:uncharacterized coiled-coil protein SlyX
MDEFDRALRDRINALECTVSQQSHDLLTLLQALCKHEGFDPDATAYRHLGRHVTDFGRTHP